MNDFVIARFVFLKLLALCTLIAFASLLGQVDGLYGSDGLLPIADLVTAVRRSLSDSAGAAFEFPSLFLLGASDVQLHLACWVGIGVSTLLFLGFATIPCLLIAWALYLSFVVAGRNFLGFQWDFLLLETLALATLLASGRMRPSRCADVAVSRIGRWPLWLLLFHLMFASGIVKYRSGDGSWKHLDALRWHFETQPLPTVIGWWAHQLPDWIKRGACAATLFIEIVVPFAIFLPRVARTVAAFAFIGLMVLIAATGNYTFFNLLTVALALLLLDDAAWPACARRWFTPRGGAPRSPPSRLRRALFPLGLLSMAISASLSIGAFTPRRAPWPEFMQPVEDAIARFGLASRYGLFEDMTETRVELSIEGSDDGVAWRPFGFRWKPGDLARAPGLVAPHQPRLDWQMWFLPLGPSREIAWFETLQRKILEGAPAVLALLDRNPFPMHPPRYLRTAARQYRFTTRSERARSGHSWTSEDLGFFGPTVELKDGVLAPVRPSGR